MKGCWKDDEVKGLFKEVEISKSRGEGLKNAFSRHAKNYGRARGSVRNYYYREVDRLASSPTRAKELEINLSLHGKNPIKYFSKEEEGEFFDKIKGMTEGGMSVRRACLTLAEGDSERMLRYQNKYRAMQKLSLPNNVIKFSKKKASITDGEIQALFSGLVRLVKRKEQEDAEERVKEVENRANSQLRKMIALLGERDRELEDMKSALAKMKKENETLLQGARRNICLKAKVLSGGEKKDVKNG